MLKFVEEEIEIRVESIKIDIDNAFDEFMNNMKNVMLEKRNKMEFKIDNRRIYGSMVYKISFSRY